eukprot:13954299-Heterocapsa_arctica.AAC.1
MGTRWVRQGYGLWPGAGHVSGGGGVAGSVRAHARDVPCGGHADAHRLSAGRAQGAGCRGA